MSSKELKDTMNEVYHSKMSYDQTSVENKLPQETLEKHLYKHLHKKYGSKNMIIDQAGSILVSIKELGHSDVEFRIFDKVLNHECDDDFL